MKKKYKKCKGCGKKWKVERATHLLYEKILEHYREEHDKKIVGIEEIVE